MISIVVTANFCCSIFCCTCVTALLKWLHQFVHRVKFFYHHSHQLYCFWQPKTMLAVGNSREISVIKMQPAQEILNTNSFAEHEKTQTAGKKGKKSLGTRGFFDCDAVLLPIFWPGFARSAKKIRQCILWLFFNTCTKTDIKKGKQCFFSKLI